MNEFSEEELITIRKAISAYIAHLEPSASYVKQVDDWRYELTKIQLKIGHILMNSRRAM